MMGLFKGKSFVEKEQERIRTVVSEPLLEQVLESLPHLLPTEKQRDDAWEIIAIKLNNHQFERELKADEDFEFPTLSGPYVKDLYTQIFDKFVGNIKYFNSSNGIYKSGVVHADAKSQASLYITFNLPVQDAYTSRADLICCQLFYLKSWDIEFKARCAKERLEKAILAAPPATAAHELDEKFDKFVVSDEVRSELQKSDKWKVERLLEELQKKNQRIELLDKENKRLMELNHTLLNRRRPTPND